MFALEKKRLIKRFVIAAASILVVAVIGINLYNNITSNYKADAIDGETTNEVDPLENNTEPNNNEIDNGTGDGNDTGGDSTNTDGDGNGNTGSTDTGDDEELGDDEAGEVGARETTTLTVKLCEGSTNGTVCHSPSGNNTFEGIKVSLSDGGQLFEKTVEGSADSVKFSGVTYGGSVQIWYTLSEKNSGYLHSPYRSELDSIHSNKIKIDVVVRDSYTNIEIYPKKVDLDFTPVDSDWPQTDGRPGSCAPSSNLSYSGLKFEIINKNSNPIDSYTYDTTNGKVNTDEPRRVNLGGVVGVMVVSVNNDTNNACIKNNLYTKLPYGKYSIRQIGSANDYTIAEQEFTISGENINMVDSSEVLYYSNIYVASNPKKAKMVIKVSDADFGDQHPCAPSGSLLHNDAVFKITNKSGGMIKYDGADVRPDNSFEVRIKDGCSAETSDLTYGKYDIQEISTNENYNVNTKKIEGVVFNGSDKDGDGKDDNDVVWNSNKSVGTLKTIISNTPKHANFTIKMKDSVTGGCTSSAFKGTKFSIININKNQVMYDGKKVNGDTGITYNGQVDLKDLKGDGQSLGEFTITSGCSVEIKNLTYSDYGIKQVAASDGYKPLNVDTKGFVAYISVSSDNLRDIEFSTNPKSDQTISFANATANATYGSTTGGQTAQRVNPTSGGGDITYTSRNTNVVTVNDTTGAITGIKKVDTNGVKICAIAAATDNYNASKEVCYMLKINKGSQKVTFEKDSITDTYAPSKALKNEASTDGDGTISYSSDKSEVATVGDNGKVTINGVGTAIITATATGTANYNQGKATYTLTVNKASQTISFATPEVSVPYGKAVDVQAVRRDSPTSGGGGITYTSGNESIAKIDGDKINLIKTTDASGVKICATAAATDNYNASDEACYILKINKAKQAVGFENSEQNITIDYGNEFTNKAYANDSNTQNRLTNANISYSSSDDTIATVDKDGKVTTKKSGKVVITAKAITDNYEDAEASYNLTVQYTVIIPICNSTNDDQCSDEPDPSIDPPACVVEPGKEGCEIVVPEPPKKPGYTFFGYDDECKGNPKYQPGDKITITDKNRDLKLCPVWGDGAITWVKGQIHTKGSKEDAVLKINFPFKSFESILVDDKVVAKENYKTEEGSTVLTIYADYLDTLESKEHKLTIAYDRDAKASTTFTVKEEGSNSSNKNSGMAVPNTGDVTDENENGFMAGGIIIPIAIVLVGAGIYVAKRKSEHRKFD